MPSISLTTIRRYGSIREFTTLDSSSTTPSSRSSTFPCPSSVRGSGGEVACGSRAGCTGSPAEGSAPVAAAIVTLLRLSSAWRSIVRGTTSVGRLSTSVLPAAERTTQVRATCVPRMREKANPALLAAQRGNAPAADSGMGLHDRVQRSLILPDKRLSAIVLVPVIAKRENFPDRYDKKARLSVTMRSVIITPSSYLLDAKASRGRARIFVALSLGIRNRDRHKRSTTAQLPTRHRQPIPIPLTTPHAFTSLLERRKPVPLFFFPSSGSIYLSTDGSIQLSGNGPFWTVAFNSCFLASFSGMTHSWHSVKR